MFGFRIILACAALLAACSPAPSASLAEIAADVAAQPAWLADAQRCPTDVMARDEVDALPESEHCSLSDSGACFVRCKAGDGASCYWLANRLQAADHDSQAANTLFMRACGLGVASGCTNRAAYLFHRGKGEDVADCTLRTFERSCELDDPWGCTMFARQLESGGALEPQQRRRVLDALGKSCLGGDDDTACIAGRKILQSLQP